MMYKDSKKYTADQQPLDERKMDYYELAVYFAAAKTQEEEFRWDNFIDNLSFICDKFASHIKSDSISHSEL